MPSPRTARSRPALSPNNGERWELLQIEGKIHAEVGAEESSDGDWGREMGKLDVDEDKNLFI